jgi:hypothetical protein
MTYPALFLDMQKTVLDKARLDTLADTPRVKDWLNMAYMMACLDTNFFISKQVTTPALTAGSTNVAVPSSIQDILWIVPTAVDGSTWGPMILLPFEQLLKMRAYQGATLNTGAPSRYSYISGGSPTIEFWPNAVGGEVLTFWGTFLPPALNADNDPPIIPEPYRRVIEYGALVHASEFQKDILTQQGYEGQYQQWIQALRGNMNTTAGSMTQQFLIEGTLPWPKANSVDQGY